MIIIEIDSNTEAFQVLLNATQGSGTHKLRIALDEGQFKIQIGARVWTPELAGAEVKADGSTVQLLRDMGFPRAAELLEGEDSDPFTDVQRFEHYVGLAGLRRSIRVEWTTDGVTVRAGRYRGWTVAESKLDGWVQTGNDRDGHEGATFATLEIALAAIDAEVAANA